MCQQCSAALDDPPDGVFLVAGEIPAAQMRPVVEALSSTVSTFTSCHPNAGLPNELGEYDEQPVTTAGLVREWAANRPA